MLHCLAVYTLSSSAGLDQYMLIYPLAKFGYYMAHKQASKFMAYRKQAGKQVTKNTFLTKTEHEKQINEKYHL